MSQVRVKKTTIKKKNSKPQKKIKATRVTVRNSMNKFRAAKR